MSYEAVFTSNITRHCIKDNIVIKNICHENQYSFVILPHLGKLESKYCLIILKLVHNSSLK